MIHIYQQVKGMLCHSSRRNVEKVLGNLSEVRKVTVDLQNRKLS